MPKFNINLTRSALNLSVSAARNKEMIVPRIRTPDHSDSGNAKAMPIASICLNGSVGRIGYDMFKQIPCTFTSTKTTAKNYEIYGELPAGDIVLSVRTPRVRNTLPFPYPPAVLIISGDPATFPFVYHDDGTISWDTTVITRSENAALRLNMFSLTDPFLYPAGTYTLSVRDYADASAPVLNLQVRPSDGSSMYTLDDSGTHSGVITFTLNKSCYLHAFMEFNSNRTYAAATIYPQLEAGASRTAYEPVNPATLTRITLPRALEDGEYLSFTYQNIMPTGTPVTLPALQTLVGENVLMIENYPELANTIILDI
jgi:hypothetical protein